MASSASTIPEKISLKLLVNKSSRKVLFAEAGKDFVDLLFGLLELPLGSIVALFVSHGMAESGSLGSIYRGVQDLDTAYMQNNQTKGSLLNPKRASSNTQNTPLLLQWVNKNQKLESGSSFSYCLSSSQACKEVVEGYVKGVVTYMVMDDLVVKPMSTISTITLLNTFHIKDATCLQEMTVEVDMDKGLKMVKASFDSTTVLTDVFLGKLPQSFLKWINEPHLSYGFP